MEAYSIGRGSDTEGSVLLFNKCAKYNIPQLKFSFKGNKRGGTWQTWSVRICVSLQWHSNLWLIAKGTISIRLLSKRKTMGFTFVRTKCWTKEGPWWRCLPICDGGFTHSNQGPITKRDNKVRSWVKIPSWKVFTKIIGAVLKR